MGRQIIKQPNGKYCIFSSIVDSVICYHYAREDLINEIESWRGAAQKAQLSTASFVDGVIRALEAGGKPYYQFTMSYEEIFETIERCHDKETSDRMRKDMEE